MNTIKSIGYILIVSLLFSCEQQAGKEQPQSTHPVWSPDGTKIAFASSKLGPGEIFVYDIKTKKEFQLTKNEQ